MVTWNKLYSSIISYVNSQDYFTGSFDQKLTQDMKDDPYTNQINKQLTSVRALEK